MAKSIGWFSKMWQKSLLLLGLATGDIARSGPIFVDIDLTARCNLRCLCCPYHSPSVETADGAPSECSDISYSLVQKLFRELESMRTASIILQGSGEPLLHPQVLDTIALAKQSGFHTSLLTNGTLLDENKIRSMIASRLDVVKISLWATSLGEYEQNYPGVPSRTFEHVLQAMQLAARIKKENASPLPLIYWHYPINHHNCRSLGRLVDMAYAAGCNGVTFSPLYELPGVDSFLRLDQDETGLVISALREARKRVESLGLRHNIDQALLRYRTGEAVWSKFACYITWYHVRVRVDGNVVPCGRCRTTFGNLSQATFRKIWNDPAIRDFRRRTRTRTGLASLAPDCDCRYCCFVGENARVHRLHSRLHNDRPV